jgi:hypothetical protein
MATAARLSSAGVVEELDALAQRTTGPTAVRAATQPIASAYRALRVGLGLDADSSHDSLEAVIRRRLVEGGFRSYGQPSDAITIAMLETGVPIVALHAEGGEVSLGVDTDGVVSLLRDGLVVAHLFGDLPGEAVPQKGAQKALLVAVVAPGVNNDIAALALDRARGLSSS